MSPERLGTVLRPKSPENTGVLTVTGLLPSPVTSCTPEAVETPQDKSSTSPAAQRERIVQDVLQQVRYLLTARKLVRLVFALLTKNTTYVRPKTLAQVQEDSLLQ